MPRWEWADFRMDADGRIKTAETISVHQGGNRFMPTTRRTICGSLVPEQRAKFIAASSTEEFQRIDMGCESNFSKTLDR